jgi:hypothetical protein
MICSEKLWPRNQDRNRSLLRRNQFRQTKKIAKPEQKTGQSRDGHEAKTGSVTSREKLKEKSIRALQAAELMSGTQAPCTGAKICAQIEKWADPKIKQQTERITNRTTLNNVQIQQYKGTRRERRTTKAKIQNMIFFHSNQTRIQPIHRGHRPLSLIWLKTKICSWLTPNIGDMKWN